MPDHDPKAAVAEVLKRRGRWAALERDPELNKHFAEVVFPANGWVPEGKDSALATFAKYARAALNGDVNGARDPFGKVYSVDEIVEQISKRTKLGSPAQIRKMLDFVRDADLHDELLERTSARDFEKPPTELDEVGSARVDEREAFRQRLGDALERDAFKAEAHKEDRLERHQAALPPDAAETPSLADDIAAAYAVVEEDK